MAEALVDHKALASWTQTLHPSPLQNLLAIGSDNLISFALGLPAREFFPLETFQQAVQHVLASGPDALQYGSTTRRLKQQIVHIMQLRGISCREEQIFLTAGAQQGLSLLTHLLLDPGGQVITETLTYTGILRVIAPFHPEIVTVPTSKEEGIDLHALERFLQTGARPAFIYLVADGHNPLGLRLSQEKRQYLAELVRRYRVPLIEDDPYSFLAYEPLLPPIRALEEHQVFYVGSLSKVLAPALRIGWIVLPEDLSSKMSAVKEAIDLDVATFAQHVATEFLDREDVPVHLRTLQNGYQQRRNLMRSALQRYLPPEISWQQPENGMYFWLELPAFADTKALLEQAITNEGVAFMPDYAFYAGKGACTSAGLRICFSYCPLDKIEEGIHRLSRLLAKTYF